MRIVRWLLLLALLPAVSSAATGGGDTMPIDQIRRGMTGYGLTVLVGTRIDTFQVEVIDVMHGSGGGGDVILARVSGLGLEKSGIAQGMSGSPIYVEGRLAGALAFAYPFAKESIAGVTPIGEMLEILDQAGGAESMSLMPVPERSGGEERGIPGPEPIATPLALAGFAPEVARSVEEFFRPYGLVATAGGGGGKGTATDWKAEPGAAVGVRLLGGDATLTGIGTVTWVDGDRILAFGHPMFQAGTVNMPLVSAEVHTLIPSAYVSFKLGSPIGVVGALVQDRRTGVAGAIGEASPTVPIDVVVESEGAGRREYHYDALQDKRLTPVLVSWAVSNSILDRGKATGDATARVRMRVDFDGASDLEMENVYASGSVVADVGEDVVFPLQVLANNPIAEAKVNSVRVEVTTFAGRQVSRIERVRVERAEVKPGGEVRGDVTLRRFQGETETRSFVLPIGEDMPEGKLLLRVCDAASSEDWDTKRAPNRFATKEIDGLVRILEELRTNESVYVQLFAPADGVTVDGREMPSLPESRLTVLGAALHDDDGAFVKGSVVASETIRTDAVVTGCKSLSVVIDRAAP